MAKFPSPEARVQPKSAARVRPVARLVGGAETLGRQWAARLTVTCGIRQVTAVG